MHAARGAVPPRTLPRSPPRRLEIAVGSTWHHPHFPDPGGGLRAQHVGGKGHAEHRRAGQQHRWHLVLHGPVTEPLGALCPAPTLTSTAAHGGWGSPNGSPSALLGCPLSESSQTESTPPPTRRTCRGEPRPSPPGRAQGQSVITFLGDREFLEKSIFLTEFTIQPPPWPPNAKCAPDPHPSSQHVRNPGSSPSAGAGRCRETVLMVSQPAGGSAQVAQGSVPKSDAMRLPVRAGRHARGQKLGEEAESEDNAVMVRALYF